jgi:serine/threonine protein kinase
LSIATNKFSEIIGQGGFSVVYRGTLNNEEVAVKKIIKDSKGEFKDFLTERATIGNTRHMNVLKIEGWCCTISNFKYWFSHTLDDVMLFLVYELIANGNLHEHLYEKPEVLSWEKRYRIWLCFLLLCFIAL